MSAKKSKDQVFVYLGPSIRGVIQNGSIYTGDSKQQVLAAIKDAVTKYPAIERLLVSDKDIASAKEKLKRGGNGLCNAYRQLKNI